MLKNKLRCIPLIFISFFVFIFTFVSYSSRGFALDFLSDYVVNYLFDRTTNNDSFKDLTSYTLQNNFTQLQIDRINGIAQDYRYNEYGERIGYANGNGGRGIGTPSRDVPSNSQPIKIYTEPSGGSHGGGGHSRETSVPVVETPTSSPVSVIENNQVYNFVTNEYETINNSYYYTNNYNSYYDINVFETEEYYITYEFNNTYYTVCIAPMSSPTDTEYFNVYYELPDGRSSFNLRAEDINGVIFNYDVISYDKSVINSDILGIWHFDGNFYNSVDNRNGSGNPNFVDGFFDGAYQLSAYPSDYNMFPSLHLYMDTPIPNDWTMQFKVYVPLSTVPGDYYAKRNSTITRKRPMIAPFVDTMDCWYDVVINSNGVVSVRDLSPHLIYDSNYLSEYFSFITVDSYFNSVVIGYDLGETINVNNYDYTTVFGLGVCIDELCLYKGIKNPSVRLQPLDLNFAYTIPNISIIEPNYRFGAAEFEDIAPFDGSEFFLCYVNGYYGYVSSLDDVSSDKLYTLYFLDDDALNYGSLHLDFSLLTDSDVTVPSYMDFDLSQLNFALNTPYYVSFKYQRTGDLTSAGLHVKFYDTSFNLVGSDFHYFRYPEGHPYSTEKEFLDHLLDYTDFFYCIFEDGTFYLKYDVKTPLDNIIALQSPVAINTWQIGGVRKFDPYVGDVFISLYNNRPNSISQYYNGVWNPIKGAVWYGGRWEDLQSFDFSRMMIISDSDGYSSGNTYNYYYYDSSVINNDYDIDITEIDNNYFEDAKDFIFSLPELLLIVPTLISSVSWLGGLGALLLIGFTVLIGLIIYKLVRR